MNVAHAYQVIKTTDATRAPIGKVIVTATVLGNGEREFEWPRLVERDGCVRVEDSLFTCRYVGPVATPYRNAA
jgi:hypothetical protein